MPQIAPVNGRKVLPGGFVLPAVWQLVAAWWCYRSGAMPLRALRTWFALWEVAARRSHMAEGRRPRFRLEELQKLVGGVGGRHLRSDLRKLRRLHLVSFESGRICFPTSPEQLAVEDLAPFWSVLEAVANHARRVPLPRRVLRYLAGCSKRVLLATVLGEAMRLLYFKSGEVLSRGRCKASWVGEVFSVDLRGVKRARQHLLDIGLLVPVGEGSSRERVFERKWGKVCVWNLDWNEGTELPPVSADSTTELPPVESDNNPPSEIQNNQNPALCGPASGSFKKADPIPEPSIRDIREEDLSEDHRSFDLYRDAIGRELVDDSEAGRLRFFGLLEHARRYGTRNRPGLFRSLLEHQRWHFITQDDEDLARRRLVQAIAPRAPRREAQRPARAPLSDDAKFVRLLQLDLRRCGFHGDPFGELQRRRPEWTHARWQAAVAELHGGVPIVREPQSVSSLLESLLQGARNGV